MKEYIQIDFKQLESEQKDILVAVLSDIGYEGFEDGFQTLTAYIDASIFQEEALDACVQPMGIPYTQKTIQEENWNAKWEADFQPVVIGDFCSVRASFHEKNEMVQHDIIVTPKMSFGTGHHATTYLMIEWMERLDFTAKSVLDFGTGTGVLAILAAQLGANSIVAIDNDDWSIDNAAENFVVNKAAQIHLKKADLLAEGQTFDILLANINRNVLLAQMDLLRNHLASQGTLVLSGLLKGDLEVIKNRIEECNMKIREVTEKGDWISILVGH